MQSPASAATAIGMACLTTAAGRLGVTEQGRGPATPILFLHGVGSDKSVWRDQIDYFGRSRRAIAFDFPGYCESRPGAEDMDRDQAARLFWEGLDSLGIERAHICGLSLGGVMALAMHANRPGRCASLIIADSFARHPDGNAIFERSVDGSGDLRSLAEQRVEILLCRAREPQLRQQVIETMAAIPPAAYRAAARAVWLADQVKRARAVDVPTLVLVGAEDAVTPPALSRELAELIPQSQYREIAGAGHLCNLDQPQSFNREVAKFIVSVERET